MRSRTANELANLIDGQVIGPGNTVLTGAVVADSRNVRPDSIFVAIAGERVDGHNYVGQARQRGARAAIVSHPVEDELLQIVVADPIAALGQLANTAINESEAVVVAVTGSSGKTTTKDLLAQIFAAEGETVAPIGSFNTEVGLPLTAISVTPQTRFLVAEMGARGIGHIDQLTAIAPPQISLVLNIGTAHLDGFGSQPGIAQAKAEIVRPLPSSGYAILNADDPFIVPMAEQTQAQVLWWSRQHKPHLSGAGYIWAEHISADELARYSFILRTELGEQAENVSISLQQSGAHQVDNALAAAAAALAAGVKLPNIAAVLNRAVARSQWRMALSQ